MMSSRGTLRHTAVVVSCLIGITAGAGKLRAQGSGYSVFALPVESMSETSATEQAGTSLGSSYPDLHTGALAASYLLEAPAGRHGLSPELALTYSSRRGNGPLGVGWSMEPGAIERDAERGVDYTASKYILVNASGSRKLIAGGQANEYQLEIEGTFARIRYLSLPDGERYFELSQKDGLRFLYGRSPATRVFDPSAPDRVFRWLLDHVEDRFGNYMEFKYERDEGQLYLARVDFNGHTSIKPTHSMEMVWETRPDVIRSARVGFKIVTAKRLQSVIVNAQGHRIHGYELRYDMAPDMAGNQTSPSTGRSLLTDVLAHAADVQTRLRPLHLEYQGSPESFLRPKFGAGGSVTGAVAERCLVGDVNADGVSDVACLADLDGRWDISIARPQGWATAKWASGPVPKSKRRFVLDKIPFPMGGWIREDVKVELAHSCFSGDFNLDRRLDVACYTGDGGRWQVGLSTGEGWLTSFWEGGANPGEPVTDRCFAGDFDGDFVTEIACHSDGANWQLMEPASGSWKISTWTSGPNPSHPIAVSCLPGDYDGDMALDLACRLGGTWQVALSRKDRWETDTWSDGPAVEGPLSARCFPGDFSGDGIADIACGAGGQSWSVALSTTKGWSVSSWNDGPSTEEPVFDRCVGADLDGDGRTDLICHLDGSGVWSASLARSDRFATTRLSNGPQISRPVWKNCRSGDFNGDGRADLGCHREGSGEWSVAFSSGKPPDLLTGVVNAIGGSVAVEYELSTAWNDRPMPFMTPVVSRVKRSSGHEADSEVVFAYNGGYFHLSKGEFRGFRHVEERGPFSEAGSGIITERWFFQGDGVGKSEREAPVGYMQGRVYKQRSRGASGHVYETVGYRYEQDDTAPYFNPMRAVRRWTCDPEAEPGCGSETLSEYTYDQYGNVTVEALHGDLHDPTDDRSLRRTFSHNRDEWLLSFPFSEQLYQGVQGGELISASNFYYDGAGDCSTPAGQQRPSKGALSRLERWLSGGDSPQTLFGFDEYGNTICVRDPRGFVTTFEFDPTKTFPTATTNPLGHRLTTTYYGVAGEDVANGIYGRQKSVVDPNGAATTWIWDGFGRLAELRQADGGTTRWRYKLLGNPRLQHVETEDAAGLIRQVYFDGFGRTWSHRESATGGRMAVVEMRTDSRGLLRARTLPFFLDEEPAPEFAFEYDELGRLTRTTMPNGTHELRCYEEGRVEVHVSPQGYRSRVVLDAMGRMRRVQQYLGAYSLCETWERLEVLSAEQRAQLTTTFGMSVSSAIAPYAENRLDYDLLGNLIRLQDSMGNVTQIKFDSLSRKVKLKDPNLGEWSYEYDANGNLARETNPTGDSVFLQYDSINRLFQKDHKRPKPEARADYRYQYDSPRQKFGVGRLSQVLYSAGEVGLSYDALGRVIERHERVGKESFVSRFDYDQIGRIATVTYSDNSAYTYRYDGPSLSRVEAAQGLVAEYRYYNALGQPAEQRFGNGVLTRYSYSGDPGAPCTATSRQLCQIDTSKPGGESLLRLRYFHDLAGKVAAIDDSSLGLQRFEHDELGRITERWVAAGSALAEVVLPATDSRLRNLDRDLAALLDLAREDRQQLERLLAANADSATVLKEALKRRDMLFPPPPLGQADWIRAERFRYNPVGNMTYRSGAGPYRYPKSGADSRTPHAVVRVGDKALSYDARGSMATSPGRTFQFDVEGRLVRVEQADSAIDYSYDHTGERVKKQFSWQRRDSRGHLSMGQLNTVSPSRLYQCFGKRCVKHIFADQQRIAIEDVASGERFYLHGDHLGSIRVVTDRLGNVAEHQNYTPFGSWIQKEEDPPPLPVVIGFTGQEFDPEVGLYYFGARYYDPELGRFLSGDPRASGLAGTQTVNRYAYAFNQPLLFVDPDGEWVIFVAAAIVGAVAAGSQSNWDPGAMVLGAFVGAASAGVGSAVGGAISGAVGGGMAGSLAGGAVGGAAGAATGSLMYRAAGYDVDVGRAALAGAAGGFFGAGFSAASTPLVGGLVGGGVSAGLSGGDFGQGAFWGAVGAIATASALSAAPEDGKLVDAEGQNMREPGVYAIKGAGSVLERLWHLILGDAYSHVVVSLGNGEFGDATPTAGGVKVQSSTYGTGTARYQQLVNRQFVKANVDLSASMLQFRASTPEAVGRSYGFSPSQFVCTTYATYVTGGQVSGLMPGQMVYNTIGYRPGYHYYDYTIHRRVD